MEGTSIITSADFSSILTTLQGQLSVPTVVEVLAIAAGACAGFAFMWWGVRKITRALMGAFKKGKISL